MNTSEIKRRVHVAGCPAGTFKSSVGNGNCTACPENSSSVSHDTTLVSAASAATCRCADGLVSHIVNGHLVRCSCKALFTVMTVMQPVAPPGGGEVGEASPPLWVDVQKLCNNVCAFIVMELCTAVNASASGGLRTLDPL